MPACDKLQSVSCVDNGRNKNGRQFFIAEIGLLSEYSAVSPLLIFLCSLPNLDAKQEPTIKAEPTLKASQPSWQSKVGQNMVLGSVQAVQAFVA